jgi:hypothetical protein
MKLDRNLNPSGKGKYALINLRKLQGDPRTSQGIAAAIVESPESVEFGIVGAPDEFWLIKLKDKYAAAALQAYADAARVDDPEFSDQVQAMVERAGTKSPFCKAPD